MQALGLIETRGLVAAVESADSMLKAAEVTLLDKTNVGGGLVTIAVTGDVAAVKAAVEAGSAAVKHLNSSLLVSEHVIPRPHVELDDLIVPVKHLEKVDTDPVEPAESLPETPVLDDLSDSEKLNSNKAMDADELHKTTIDQIVFEDGIESVLDILEKQRVTKLRNLAREYKELGIAGRSISKADKQTLLSSFNEYYGKLTHNK